MRSKSLSEFGEKYYYTDAVKCPFQKDGENAGPPVEAIENCRSFLLREIKLCKSEVVCTLGKIPLKTLLRVKKFNLWDFAGRVVPESYLRQDVRELKCKIFSSWFPTSMIPETQKIEAMKTLKELLNKG
jgi:uracil-DNA glycosylase family 4